jgi:3-dehydroquinate synthetase
VAGAPEALAYAVEQSCRIKAHIVELDEHESGVRAHLNFGHTFGHAIEAGSGYGNWLHGEAVAAGMVLAAQLSHRLGRLSAQDVVHIRTLLERAGLPVVAPPFGSARYLELMSHDKKAQGGRLQFVLLEKLGAACVSEAREDEVTAVLEHVAVHA